MNASERHLWSNAQSLRMLSPKVQTSMAWSLAAAATGNRALNLTLPPEEKPKTHWPWWLRILAVIGVLFFIRLVAGTVRSKPSGPGSG